MSTWTHVCGCIRVDYIPVFPAPNFKKILGEIDADDTILPCGSEGSLQYDIWKNPSKSCAAKFTISVFGDLRDYGEDLHDIQKIIEWFENVTLMNDLLIRNAILQIEVESKSSYVLRYVDGGFNDEGKVELTEIKKETK